MPRRNENNPTSGKRLRIRLAQAAPLELLEPALRPDFGRSGNEELHFGVWRDDRADVAPVQHCSAGLLRKFLLTLQQGGAHRRIGRDHRGDLRYRLAAQFLVRRIEPKLIAGSKRLELIPRVSAPPPQVE